MRAAPLQNNFSGGELSPLLVGRVDSERYSKALLTCLNYIPILQGALLRRPGTKFVAEVKDSTKATRLIEFEFSTTQAYILEFGDQYIRFYMNGGQIQSGGSPHEIASPFLEADLFELKFTQSADVLYIVHPDYEPRKLSRTGHTSWTLEKIEFQDGPYLPVNDTSTTLSNSATSGSITITASSTTGINAGDGFKSTDVGRLIRIKDSANNWTWVKITGHTSSTEVSADVEGPDFDTASSTEDWRLGLWSETTGFPSCTIFYEDRLSFAGSTEFPQRVDMSETGEYEHFAPTEADGTVTDASAIAFSISANQVNVIRWMMNDDKGLLMGTLGAEWIVRPSRQGEALTPTNVNAKSSTAWGSDDIQPVQIGHTTMFVQRSGRKVREINYYFDSDGYRAIDLTVLAEHVTKGGVVEMAKSTSPHPILWAVRKDGMLLGMTYEREADTLVAGWHRHQIGGVSDASGTKAKVESVAVIPSSDGSRDELWTIVQRHVNGATVRYVEYLTKFFEDEDAQEDQFFVDSGLTYDGAAATTISGLDHLEGETVSILADGAVVPDQEVSSGQIELDEAAEVVHAGLGYKSDGQMPRIEAGSADGTALGKTRRIHRLGFLFWRTLGFKFGQAFDDLQAITFRKASDNLGEPTPLFSGIKSDVVEFDYDFNNTVCWRQEVPVNGTLLALMPQMRTEDRG